MSYCPHCGAPLPEGARFCSRCGNPIAAQPQQPSSQQQYDQSSSPHQQVYGSQQPPRPQGPEHPMPQKRRGWLILLLIAAVVAGVYFQWGRRDTAKPQSKSDLVEQAIAGASSGSAGNTTTKSTGSATAKSASNKAAQSAGNATTQSAGNATTKSTVQETGRQTVGSVTFTLADGYAILARERLRDGEACLIGAGDGSSAEDRLILKIHPDALKGIDGLTSEEVAQMLSAKVDDLAGVMADKQKSDFNLAIPYKVHFEEADQGGYPPHCYSSFYGTVPNGDPFYCYTEAALVSGKIVSGCAISSNRMELNALGEIFREVVAAAAN